MAPHNITVTIDDPELSAAFHDVRATSTDRLLISAVYQIRLLQQLLKLGERMMASLQDLQAAVAAEGTVVASAVTLLNGVAAQIAALQPNQEAIDALAAEVTTQTAALAAAVVAVPPPAA